MKTHRFYYNDKPLTHGFWLDDERILHQWLKVLRFGLGSQAVLFDGVGEDRLYEITKIGDTAVHLNLVTELKRQIPKKDVYLFFSLLKKDKNDWVLQKGTELGVNHFVPILSMRTEKTGFVVERAEKIVTEAAEQCGRSNVPKVREPITVETALDEFSGKILLFWAEQSDQEDQASKDDEAVGVFIGPEGGWTDSEKQLLSDNCQKLSLSDFTLRAETACVIAASKLA